MNEPQPELELAQSLMRTIHEKDTTIASLRRDLEISHDIRVRMRDKREATIEALREELSQAKERISQASKDETGWLVEDSHKFGYPQYRYFDSTGLVGWTRDANEAIRFARRIDAEQFAAADEDAFHIVEHMWCQPPSGESSALWTPEVKHALLDIAHHAYHIVDDSEQDESDDHTNVCAALDRLEPESTDPHERLAQLRASVGETSGESARMGGQNFTPSGATQTKGRDHE